MSEQLAVCARNVVKRYGRRAATLVDVDLDVDLQSLGARERRLTLAAAPEPAGDT